MKRRVLFWKFASWGKKAGVKAQQHRGSGHDEQHMQQALEVQQQMSFAVVSDLHRAYAQCRPALQEVRRQAH